MGKTTTIYEDLEKLRPVQQNMAICCAIDLLGDDAVTFVAEPFRSRARKIIEYRKEHRMTPFGPHRDASDA